MKRHPLQRMVDESKQVKNLQSGEVFFACPDEYWPQALQAWKGGRIKECPMPAGHMMFDAGGLYHPVDNQTPLPLGF